MKYSKIFAIAAAAMLAVGCTDTWDEHYQSDTSAGSSLWQLLTADAELSNFCLVLDSLGYRPALAGSQTFTVFAPTNAAFSTTQADSIINLYKSELAAGHKNGRNAAIKEFVRNHVALYNYSVSELTNDSVVMMNGKYQVLKHGSIGDQAFRTSNQRASNGLLYTINEIVDYQPNIYEYIARDAELDSVATYIYRYSVERFDADESVPGEYVDGKMHYLDSVTYLYNKLLRSYLNANVECEDSTYMMLVPTNQAWDSIVSEYENYFVYDKKVKQRDSLMYNNPRVYTIAGAVFSASYNTEKSMQDSLACTLVNGINRYEAWGSYEKHYWEYFKPYEEGGVFSSISGIKECSNGKVMKSDYWNISKYDTFVQDRQAEGESYSTLDSVFHSTTADLVTQKISNQNHPLYNQVSNHQYGQITPTGAGQIQALFSIRGLMSNLPYDIYVVIVPSLTLTDSIKNAPLTFRASVMCHDIEGKEKWISNKDKGSKLYDVTYSKEVLQYNTTVTTANLENDPMKVDTIFIGTYEFPTCSWNTDEPQVKLMIQSRTSSTKVNAGTGIKDLNLDCIIAKPKK